MQSSALRKKNPQPSSPIYFCLRKLLASYLLPLYAYLLHFIYITGIKILKPKIYKYLQHGRSEDDKITTQSIEKVLKI